LEVEKDVTPELKKQIAKNSFYRISGVINRMLAPQYYKRPFTYEKKGWGEVTRVESYQDGTPKELRAPTKKKRKRKGESEVKSGDCWTFKEEKGKILLPWGTSFGLLKSSLRRSLIAQRRTRYWVAPLDLIKIYPTWLDVGNFPPESMKDGKMPEVVLETRHTTKGDVMVETFFDYIENRPFTCLIEVDSECPLNEEKLVAFIKTLNTLDNIGPSKRGSMTISTMQRVVLSEEEMKKLRKGELEIEPVQPVIY